MEDCRYEENPSITEKSAVFIIDCIAGHYGILTNVITDYFGYLLNEENYMKYLKDMNRI